VLRLVEILCSFEVYQVACLHNKRHKQVDPLVFLAARDVALALAPFRRGRATKQQQQQQQPPPPSSPSSSAAAACSEDAACAGAAGSMACVGGCLVLVDGQVHLTGGR